MKNLSKIAWIINLGLPIGILLKAFHLPGSTIIVSIATSLFIFIFLPIYYFKQKDYTSKFYKSKTFKGFQFIAFFLLGISNLYFVQSWPGAGLLKLVSIPSNLLILTSFLFVNKVRVKYPSVLACFIIVFTVGFVGLENSISRRGASEKFINEYKEMKSKNDEFIFLLDRSEKNGHNSMINYLNSFQQNLVSITENTSLKGSHILLDSVQGISSLYNYDLPTIMLVGPDPENPISSKYSAFELKNKLKTYCFSSEIIFPSELKSLTIFSFDSITYENEVFSWEYALFYRTTLMNDILTIEYFKNFVLNQYALKSRHSINQRLKVKSLIKKAKEIEKMYLGAGNSISNAHKPFRIMMSITLLLIVFIFQIPRFKIPNNWKNRILLFTVVIIFEYILLLTDYFIGLFSKNVLSILIANIILALGLVTLDNFLRNNFLKWYEPDQSD